MKRFLALTIAVLMLLCTFASCSQEQNDEGGTIAPVETNEMIHKVAGTYNDQYYYEYIEGDEVAIIKFAASHEVHAISVPAVIDDRPVTKIADSAFKDMNNISEVTLPDSIRYIGVTAFANCVALSKINIPDVVVFIGEGAFASTALVEITLPDGLETLEARAFYGCKSLTVARLPVGLEVIPTQLFMNCPALATVAWGNAITEIGSFAFSGCKALAAFPTLSTEATTIGRYAFDGCAALTTVNLPAKMNSIGEGAFYGCTGLTAVNFADTTAEWTLTSDEPFMEPSTWVGADAAQNVTALTDTYVRYFWEIPTV